MSIKAKLRRITLNQQGLLRRNHFGRGKAAALRVIEHLGYVQIDTISVVERAHHHVLWSRVENYRPRFLQQLVRERKVFEYWFHAAAWLPMRDYRFALPRMAKMHGDRSWFPDSDPKLQQHVLRRIEEEGPLRARDFVDADHDARGWWEWKPAKQALDQLFMQGELMISAREGFQKVYDLPQRVLPDWVDTRPPSPDEYAAYLVDTTLRAHGFASLKSIAYLRKGQKLRNAIKEQVEARIARHELVRLNLAGSPIYIEPRRLESRAPRSHARVRILSPFDNLVIQRERTRELFGFDYQIECYVPRANRKYGYFCLPLLYRDGLVGRIDCKAHRKSSCLEVISCHIEKRVDKAFAGALEYAIDSYREFNGCERLQPSPSAAI